MTEDGSLKPAFDMLAGALLGIFSILIPLLVVLLL
jgi:hypothetical protein